MPKENKHDRFSRELCEGLLSHFGPDYAYDTSGGEHSLLKRTTFGCQRIGVVLSGANAPYKSLEFHLGVSHNSFQEIVARLELEKDYPTCLDHFWSTTFNCIKHFIPGSTAGMGIWQIDLNCSGQKYVKTVLPNLRAVSGAFFARFSDLVNGVSPRMVTLCLCRAGFRVGFAHGEALEIRVCGRGLSCDGPR